MPVQIIATFTAQFLKILITSDNHTTRHCCQS